MKMEADMHRRASWWSSGALMRKDFNILRITEKVPRVGETVSGCCGSLLQECPGLSESCLLANFPLHVALPCLGPYHVFDALERCFKNALVEVYRGRNASQRIQRI